MLLESENEDDFINNLKKFGLIEKSPEKPEDFSLEGELYKTILKRARKHMIGSPFNIGVLLGFIVLQTINIKNLVILLESKKIKYETEKLTKMLVLHG